MKKALMFTALGLFFAFQAWAQDTQFPVAAYSGPELEKIQQWESQWAGKKIDKSNIEQVSDYLPGTISKTL